MSGTENTGYTAQADPQISPQTGESTPEPEYAGYYGVHDDDYDDDWEGGCCSGCSDCNCCNCCSHSTGGAFQLMQGIGHCLFACIALPFVCCSGC
ncbi:hypothetical protein M408DRAFT_329517 [Serendipita vermifera MAFF 305830]|uniref:Uncharacterized protein n=1 Tax=Serendipita vermifera MAFF 305830 TaxID=933852 RepID=A0A0C3AJC8_SERVB|nr:hypothetical protein M408DRAFT_334401 [Serendipita vermifera MAFF 305830]KIM28468.1 hypothetical protein M408DRAFT_329517 [Serendipita vermifera MAFF 305830]